MSDEKPMSITAKSSITATILTIIFFVLVYQKMNAVISYIIAVNIVTFLFYGIDKWSATKDWNRTPEIVLHGLALAGGSPAAFLSQKLFSHKDSKTSFQISYWLIVIIQIILLCFYFFKWAKG